MTKRHDWRPSPDAMLAASQQLRLADRDTVYLCGPGCRERYAREHAETVGWRPQPVAPHRRTAAPPRRRGSLAALLGELYLDLQRGQGDPVLGGLDVAGLAIPSQAR